MTTHFDIDDIAERIAVQKPYFAFNSLWQEGEHLVGNFVPEQELGGELGYLSAAELGRHLAILGSCAAVSINDGINGYYLATQAHYTGKAAFSQPKPPSLSARAKVLSMDKRSLKIAATAYAHEPIAELVCEYFILPPALFQRSFKHYIDTTKPMPSASSPYCKRIPLHHVEYLQDGLSAFSGPLEPEQCAGHFHHYPSWPVAIIAHTVFKTNETLFNERYGAGTQYHVLETRLCADKLVSAKTALRFVTQIVDEDKNRVATETKVFREDEQVASFKSTFDLQRAQIVAQ